MLLLLAYCDVAADYWRLLLPVALMTLKGDRRKGKCAHAFW